MSVTVRRIISENENRVTMLIHGDSGATGVFVDPKEFSNPITVGGATGYLPYYEYYIDAINWSMDSGTNIHLNWAGTGESLMGLNGTGNIHFVRDYRSHVGPVYPGGTGFTGVLNAVISGASVKGWTIVLSLQKPGQYFTKNPYETDQG